MTMKKTIAVVGATGAQGGGLVRAILADRSGEFAARAITRDRNSEGARRLADLGAEVVEADLDRPTSLARAFRGAYGAYCVTFYWDHQSPDIELGHARAQAAAAREEGVRHVIWSTLEDTRRCISLDDPRMPTLMGRWKVPHLDAKGEAHRYFYLAAPTTFLRTSFYWENFIHFGMGPKPDASGQLVLTLPMGAKRLPGIAAEDIGRCAYGIFRVGPALIGRVIGISGEHPTGAEMARVLTDVLGRPVRYNAVEPETYRGLGFPGAEELGNMFQFKHDFNEHYCRSRDLAFTRRLNPALSNFRSWAEDNRAALGNHTAPTVAAAA
ncbi:NmrA/HSCARG family protein [Aurantimonas sp. VKM B-3413]|uniref:NmrA/HSCARG family protein n=1 Tax=Aurantimonas sp. VKM B-3413 TaxID=2779401 RepID=UPI001E3B3626|nr:NmrA/HSCARG family protein [Aurantimonas sp. VKM B-3413]MCB8839750.1 NmrA/HSCARG family protein [Aurantimonas sp. VKM B-3413]